MSEAEAAAQPQDPAVKADAAPEDGAKDTSDVLSSSSQASRGSKDKQSNPPSPSRKAEPLWDESVAGHHRLQGSWSFWYYEKPDKNKADIPYEEQMVHVGEFSTIEGFWAYYTRMRRVGQLPKGASLFLARGGREQVPAWEVWPEGGHWMVMLRKGGNVEGYPERLNRLWEQLVIALLGEAFEDPRVCCAVCNIRPREDQLQIWVDNKAGKQKSGYMFQQLLCLGGQSLVEFKSHTQSLKDMSGSKNAQAYRVPGEVAEGDTPTDSGEPKNTPKLGPAPSARGKSGSTKGPAPNTGGRRQSQKGGRQTKGGAPATNPGRSPHMVPVPAHPSAIGAYSAGSETPIFSYVKPPRVVPPSPGSKALDLQEAPPGYRTPKRTPGNTPHGTPGQSPAGAPADAMAALDLGGAATTKEKEASPKPAAPGKNALDLVSPIASLPAANQPEEGAKFSE